MALVGTVVPTVEPSFDFDLAGRVRNLGLPASAVNSLIPLFEAVSNGLHAIEARWQAEATKSGEITIKVIRRSDDDGSGIVGFEIIDNGIGLTEENWKSFRTSDSDFKIQRGGKGVGRLAWLKAFSNCEITSRFVDKDGQHWRRSFSFALPKGVRNPIQGHTITRVKATKPIGTTVRLEPFQTNFESHCPKKVKTIAAKLVGHFLSYFVIGKLPKIKLIDDETIELGKFYSDHQQRNDIKTLTIKFSLLDDEPTEFSI